MSSLTYGVLQFGSAMLVLFFLIIAFHLLTEKLKLNRILSVIIIGLSYFIVGLLTYNVKMERIGSVCCDDYHSGAISSGACAQHGGVREWEVKYSYEEYQEPINTIHKIFYFWYALNKDHVELEYNGCEDDQDDYQPLGVDPG